MPASTTYWAAAKPSECAAQAEKFLTTKYNNYTSGFGFYERSRKMYEFYYGLGKLASSGGIGITGKYGQLRSVFYNQFRLMVQTTLSLLTSVPLGYTVEAINSESSSRAEALIDQGVLNAVASQFKFEEKAYEAAEAALVLNDGYIVMDWDSEAGEPVRVDPDTLKTVNTGDLTVESHSPLTVTRPASAPDGSIPWYMVTRWRNKFDIAARYATSHKPVEDPTADSPAVEVDQELYDKIINSSPSRESMSFLQWSSNKTDIPNELIPVTTFYHAKTDACPKGRKLIFIDRDTVLSDGPLGFPRMNVLRLHAGKVIGTNAGYSPANEMLGMVEVTNALLTVMLSNIAAFGIQNIMSHKGNSLNTSQLTGNIQVIEYQKEKPEAFQPTGTPPEVPQLIEWVTSKIPALMGHSDVSMGQLNPASRMSASVYSQIQDQARRYASNFAGSYSRMLVEMGELALDIINYYAKEERVQEVIGEIGTSFLRDFTGDKLSKRRKVTVKTADLITSNPGARFEIVPPMLQYGMFKSPNEVSEYLATGRLQTYLEPGALKNINLAKEKELLSQGIVPKVLASDDPTEHGPNAVQALDTPGARNNPQVVQAVAQYLQELLAQAKSLPPEIAAVLGHRPIQPPAPLGGPPNQGAAPPQPPPAPPTEKGPGQ